MIALICPGQGGDIEEGHLGVARRTPLGRELLALAASLTGRDLERDVQRQDAALEQTEVAQPLIAALVLGAYAALGSPKGLVLGHSLGDLLAASIAGYLGPDDTVRIARIRGEQMAALARVHPGGLVATSADPAASGLALAAHNAADEWVVAYLEAEKARALALPGARRLSVSGPWHHPVMGPAVEPVAAAVSAALRPGRLPWLALPLSGTMADVPALLAGQLTRPVRFYEALQRSCPFDVCTYITLGPARALHGLVRKVLPSANICDTGTYRALDEANVTWRLAEAISV